MQAILWGFLTKRPSVRAVESLTECGFPKRPRGRLTPEQILAVVRAHGASENHGPWTVEVIGEEDSQVWCGPGVGIPGLGFWRVMADNVVSR